MRDMLKETQDAEKFAIPIVAKHLNESEDDVFHVSLYKPEFPVDFLLKGKKFDVKYANPTYTSRKKKERIWDFDLRNKIDYCDYLVLIGVKNYKPYKLFLIPAINIPVRHIRISIEGNSKWHQFLIWPL